MSFLSIFDSSERLVIIDQDRAIGLQRFTTVNSKPNFAPDDQAEQNRFTVPVAHDVALNPHLFVVTKDGKYLFTCGHWDNSFKLSSLEKKHLTRSFVAHNGSLSGTSFSFSFSFLSLTCLSARRRNLFGIERQRQVAYHWLTRHDSDLVGDHLLPGRARGHEV